MHQDREENDGDGDGGSANNILCSVIYLDEEQGGWRCKIHPSRIQVKKKKFIAGILVRVINIAKEKNANRIHTIGTVQWPD